MDDDWGPPPMIKTSPLMETSLIKEDLNKTPEKSAQDYVNLMPAPKKFKARKWVSEEELTRKKLSDFDMPSGASTHQAANSR